MDKPCIKVKVRLLNGEGRPAWLGKSESGQLVFSNIYTDVHTAQKFTHDEVERLLRHHARDKIGGFQIEEMIYDKT